MNTESSTRRIWFVILMLSFLCYPLAAPAGQEDKNIYSQVIVPIQNFEKLIADAIKVTLPGEFGVVQKPKGWFKPDAGYSFSFLVNVNRGIINSPFGRYPDPNALSPEAKRKKIDGLKDLLVNILFSYGSRMPQLQKDKPITIVGYFEEFQPDNGVNQQKTLILSVLKSDIDESLSKPLTQSEFRNRVKIVEY